MMAFADPSRARNLVQLALADQVQGSKLVASMRFDQGSLFLAQTLVVRCQDFGTGRDNYLALIIEALLATEALTDHHKAVLQRAHDELVGSTKAQPTPRPDQVPETSYAEAYSEEGRLRLFVSLERPHADAPDVRVKILVPTGPGGRATVHERVIHAAAFEDLGRAGVAHGPSLIDDALTRVQVGEALATAVFGGVPEQRQWLPGLVPIDRPERISLRRVEADVRFETDDDELLGWSWRALTWGSMPLEREGWSISQCKTELVENRVVELRSEGTALIAGPSDDPELMSRRHLDEVEALLGKYFGEHRVTRVHSVDGLVNELDRSTPSLFYFYGHGVRGRRPELELDSTVPLESLQSRFGTDHGPLRLVYLNACDTGGMGHLGGGRIFSPICPYVLANPGKVDAHLARATALDMLKAILEDNLQPQDALRDAAYRARLVHRDAQPGSRTVSSRVRQVDPVNPVLLRRADALRVVLSGV